MCNTFRAVSPDRLFRHGEEDASPRGLALSGLFLVALAAMALSMFGLSHALSAVGPGYIEDLNEKWDHLEAHHDDYDVLFIGSSRVHHHVNVMQLDHVLATAGVNVQSYNAGLPSLDILEAEELVSNIERWRPRKLKLVVLEPVLRSGEYRNATSERGMRNQTWARTQFAMRYALQRSARGTKQELRRVFDAATQLHAATARLANLGRLARRIMPTLPRRPISHAHGYVGLQRQERFRARREAFLRSDAEGHRRVMADPPANLFQTPPLSVSEQAFLADLVSRLRAVNVEVAFVLGPAVFARKTIAAPAYTDLSALHVPTFNYLLTFGAEEIYQPDFWFDRGHLNNIGATEFTRLLANDLTPLMREMFAPSERERSDRGENELVPNAPDLNPPDLNAPVLNESPAAAEERD